MQYIPLTNTLCIKKLEPYNGKDLWLIDQLDHDSLVGSPGGYLPPLRHIKDTRYLYRDVLYAAPYAIYLDKYPIGYIEISEIFQTLESVDIAYALLQEARGKGYMTKVLDTVSRKILLDYLHDIKKITLEIHRTNTSSIAVAQRSGFIRDEETVTGKEYVRYQRKKKQL